MNAAISTASGIPNERPGHNRTRSATALKGILTKGHKRTTSEAPKSPSRPQKENSNPYNPFAATSMPTLPPGHPHSGQNVLGERQYTNSQSPPKKTAFSGPGLHKKTKSVASLRELVGSRDGKDSTKEKPASNSTSNKEEKKRGMKDKKTKSSANLAGVFGKSRPSNFEEDVPQPPKEKENTTPPSSSGYTPQTPIWAQFASRPHVEHSTTAKVPLKEGHSVKDEIALYMPQEYSPSKGRNFYDFGQPTLGKKERPKSDGLTMSRSATNFMETLSRKRTDESKSKPSDREASSKSSSNAPTMSGAKKGGKVMAAVTMFDKKSKQAEEGRLDPKEIDAAFEAVLDARNIPENMRQKMRSLKTSVKADFIKSHKAEIAAASSKNASTETTATQSKPSTAIEEEMSAADRRELESYVQAEIQKSKTSSKRNRPRSRTFTFSKGDISPSKKAKNDSTVNEKKGSFIPKSPSSTSLGKGTNSSVFGKGQKSAVPDEYVSYLRKIQRPEEVEVGKLHKLRLLLRNETVSWVDNFIQLGGMTDIVDLLHRIMQVEWREEHEDTLLHEALLCLKGLCTTSLALSKLSEIADTLFPALISMLFDPEHKGPSEFATRTIIINLLFMHLSAATKNISTLPQRAEKILDYLRDPAPEAGKEPLPWIKEMHQSRPYVVWNREIVNVTKEVFWIFLHHLNVVPLPSQPAVQTQLTTNSKNPAGSTGSLKPAALPGAPKQPQPENLTAEEYLARFYPQPRPPHPAAPYVGGVEWDATHYLSSHLDLLNALLSSLPTPAQRNALRSDLLASGFEKIMGGSLRTCKEKFYAHVHDGLRTWVAAAAADGWSVGDVRMGPKQEVGGSPKKSPAKKGEKAAPKLEDVPKLDLRVELEGAQKVGVDESDEWV